MGIVRNIEEFDVGSYVSYLVQDSKDRDWRKRKFWQITDVSYEEGTITYRPIRSVTVGGNTPGTKYYHRAPILNKFFGKETTMRCDELNVAVFTELEEGPDYIKRFTLAPGSKV